MTLYPKNQIEIQPNRLVRMSLESGPTKLVRAPDALVEQSPPEKSDNKFQTAKFEKPKEPTDEDIAKTAELEKKLGISPESKNPKETIESNIKTLEDAQKLNPEKMEPAEIREKLAGLTAAQIRTLEVTNPALLFKACFSVQEKKLVFDSGGVDCLEKGVGLRVLPQKYQYLKIDGQNAYRIANGVFVYKDGSYARVNTGKQTIDIPDTPPDANELAELNANKNIQKNYERRDLNHFLEAYGGAGTGSDSERLKIFQEMLRDGKIKGIPEDLQKELEKGIDGRIKDNQQLAKLMNMSEQQYAEIMKQGGNAQIAFEYLKASGLGLTNEQIAGIIGNLQSESGINLNPGAVGDSGTSFGIAQWHNERWAKLNEFSNSNNMDPGTLRAQLGFLVYELQTSEAGALSRLQGARTPEEAANIFNAAFERSRDTSSARANQAQRIYGQMRKAA
ncbi:MAG: phage tail tip lysozyme [Patescibacteria group bacterium]